MNGIYVSASHARQVLFLIAEAGFLVLALFAASALRFAGTSAGGPGMRKLLPRAVVTALVIQVCCYYSDLYQDRAQRRRVVIFLRLGQSFLAAVVLLSVAYYLFPAMMLGRGILFIYMCLVVPTLLVWHGLRPWVAGHEALRDTVLVLGTGVMAQQIAEDIRERAPLGYRVAGFLAEHPAQVGRSLLGPPILGTTEDLRSVVRRVRASMIVVALDDRRGKLPLDELLQCRLNGVRVEEASSFYERLSGKVPVSNLRPSWLVFAPGFHKTRMLLGAKQALELLVASVALVLVSPLLALLFALIKLDSRGPVLYRQERVGEGGKPFDLFKLRTMRTDAESATGPVWASAVDDPRITRVGRLLRKTRLDELPQLLNVLRGEMSFVGPRPERPHFVGELGKLIPYYDQRHAVKPGITGWAQVKFRYGSTIEDAEEKLQFDLYYIKNMSLLLDVAILLETVKVVVCGRGAR